MSENKIIRCIVVEDQPPAQRILQKFIGEVDSLRLEEVFSDGIQASEYLKIRSVDLMFLDIHLPRISGLEFLKSLPSPPSVILTTAYTDYALEGYDLNVIDYLLKPFSFQRFLQAIHKIPGRLQAETSPASAAGAHRREGNELFVKSGHEYVRVLLDEILFIASDTDYTEIQLSGQKVLSGESLKYWSEQLDQEQFMQVHRSYIINRKKVHSISASQVRMINGDKIPIGRTYKEVVVKNLLS